MRICLRCLRMMTWSQQRMWTWSKSWMTPTTCLDGTSSGTAVFPWAFHQSTTAARTARSCSAEEDDPRAHGGADLLYQRCGGLRGQPDLCSDFANITHHCCMEGDRGRAFKIRGETTCQRCATSVKANRIFRSWCGTFSHSVPYNVALKPTTHAPVLLPFWTSTPKGWSQSGIPSRPFGPGPQIHLWEAGGRAQNSELPWGWLRASMCTSWKWRMGSP